MIRIRQSIAALALCALLAPASARAEILVTPFFGKALKGSLDGKRTTYGGAVAILGGGTFGVEAELSYIKDFLGATAVPDTLDSNKVQSLSANLLVAMPKGSARLYATGGVSLLRPDLKDRNGFVVVDEDKFGFNAGGGIFLFTSDHAAIRGDVRYFRAFSEIQSGVAVTLGKLDYWRGALGITLKF